MGKYTDFLKSQKGLKEGAYLIKEDFSGVERPISFDKGYQVSFMRPTDSYTDAETDAVIADIKRKVGDDNVYLGVFDGEPELSFHYNGATVNAAIRISHRFNQHSIYDWERNAIIRDTTFDSVKELLSGKLF